MSFRTRSRRLLASSLVLLLASCSATRYPVPGPTGPHELAGHVLIIEEAPSGLVTHSWKPLDDLDPTHERFLFGMTGVGRGFVRVSTTEDYCRGRLDECLEQCLGSRRPIQIGHLVYPKYRGPWSINKGRWCQEACTTLYSMCINGNGPWAGRAVEFSETESALDWIKNHRQQILVGTVIVIAGVAFVAAAVASGGTALYFAPLVLLAEHPAGPPDTTWLAEAAP